jgi:hypothetical protein
MTRAKKIGIFLIIAALLLPSATLPFITEYHPKPGICLTSNFFSNLGNMVVVFGGAKQMNMSVAGAETVYSPLIAIPYRYLFVLGVILGCIGIGILALSSSKFLVAGSRARKMGIIIILAGLCLPVVTMPYITEFRPQPDTCLSLNFFGNLRNMIVNSPFISIPYRYLFVLGIHIACIGMGTIVLSSGKTADVKSQTLSIVKVKK